jgi:hypothetical protein
LRIITTTPQGTNVSECRASLVLLSIIIHHKSLSSISYSFEYNLKSHKAKKNGNVTLTINLDGRGQGFKIIGLMLCRQQEGGFSPFS